MSLVVQSNLYSPPLTNVRAQNKVMTAPTSSHNPTSVSFGAASNPAIATANPVVTNVRTQLTTAEEKKKYSDIISILDKQSKKNIELLLKNGKLLNNNSNDKSTTLDNLHKILTNPRAQGLESKVIMQETVNAIANPFTITQNFGDIPKQYVPQALAQAKAEDVDIKTKHPQENPTPSAEITEKSIDVKHSGSCVGASLEFDLASRMPAEFARFAEGLSSKDLAVTKKIQLKNLSDKTLDAIWLLNNFEVPYEMKDFNSATLKLAPDAAALTRAQIQNSHKDKMERSAVDVLMQSTFLNVGSQQTYNSLTDTRKGKFTPNDTGLIEFEKTFTESVVEDKNEISVIYQTIDEDGKLVGYEKDFGTMKKEILGSLAMGQNVVIGYTFTDNTNKVIGGHEVTIIGVTQDKSGKLIFICNDTDDDNPNPIAYPEDYIIPRIHHAGLPQEIAEAETKTPESWVEGLNAYKEVKDLEDAQAYVKSTIG